MDMNEHEWQVKALTLEMPLTSVGVSHDWNMNHPLVPDIWKIRGSMLHAGVGVRRPKALIKAVLYCIGVGVRRPKALTNAITKL